MLQTRRSHQLMQGSLGRSWVAQHPSASLEGHGRKRSDTGDKVLAKPIAVRLIHAFPQQCRRGLIDGTEKHLGARVWRLPMKNVVRSPRTGRNALNIS